MHAFMQKYDHIINTLTCIVRSFKHQEFLSVFCAVGVVIGIQIVQPYLSFTYFNPVTYGELIPTMQMLYDDLRTNDVTKLLDLLKPAFNCVSNETFQQRNRTSTRYIKQEIILIHKTRIMPLFPAATH